MPQQTDEPAAFYDRITAAWAYLLGENLHYGLFESEDDPLDAATNRLSQRMAKGIDISPCDHVLDVGCGTGMPACWLARTFGCRVTGISNSDSGIAAARARAEKAGLSNRVSFENRDAMNNGFPDASFTCAWVMESSHLMPSKESLIAECARVLAPGGRMVLCDIVLQSPVPLAKVLQHAKQFDLLRRVFGRAKMETLSWYADRAAGGFTEITTEDLTVATRPTFARWRENAEKNRRQVEALAGADYWQDFTRCCTVLEQFWDDGTLGYGILTAQRAPAVDAR